MPAANTACVACGSAFYGSPGHLAKGWAKFCSIACRTSAWQLENHPSWRGGLTECTCERCGKTFGVKPSHVAKGDGHFCSRECQFAGGRVDCKCERCGKTFERFRSHAAREFGKYCSRACSSAAQRTTDGWNSVCAQCGKNFYAKPSDLKRPDKKGVGRYCSMVCKAQWMSGHAMATGRARGQGGKRADLNNRYFRSSWEANWARYLNWLQSVGDIQCWDYECETFQFGSIKRGSRFYTPDFKVTNKNGSIEFHEVKGWMDPKSATKLKRMKKYYPSIKVIVVDRPVYRSVNKLMSGLVPGWERFKG